LRDHRDRAVHPRHDFFVHSGQIVFDQRVKFVEGWARIALVIQVNHYAHGSYLSVVFARWHDHRSWLEAYGRLRQGARLMNKIKAEDKPNA